MRQISSKFLLPVYLLDQLEWLLASIRRVRSFNHLLDRLSKNASCFVLVRLLFGDQHLLAYEFISCFESFVHLLNKQGCRYSLRHLVEEVLYFHVYLSADDIEVALQLVLLSEHFVIVLV